MSDIAEIRQLYSFDKQEWDPIRTEGDKDMRYVAGDPWEPQERRNREKVNRPVLNADELSQYVNQTVNEVRANKRAVKFSPVGNGANDKTAAFYADKMREIEYRSRAQIAYTTAFQNAVERSFGFVRVNSRYLHPRATAQDLFIDTVHNPNLITPDPTAQMPDLSDMKHCWVREQWAVSDYNGRWEKYKFTDKSLKEAAQLAPEWVSDGGVFIGELWRISCKERTLLITQGLDPQAEPMGVFKEEYDQSKHGIVLSERKVDDPKVTQILTNGIDTLDTVDWPGKYIPIVGCFGKMIYVSASGQDKRQILSMIRLARDPQMAYAAMLTSEIELISGIPKFPYFVRRGSLKPDQMTLLQKSVYEPVPVIQVEAMLDGMGGNPPEMPQRNPYSAEAVGQYELAKEAARRAIQAAMGQTPLPTAAQRRNEKSGVALKHLEELGQRGSFHFTDHYLDMITQVGVIIEDLIGHTYDTPRDVGIRKADDTSEVIRINDPENPDAVSTRGDHLVTVSTGPSFDSEREAASDFADTLIASPVVQMLGPEKGPKLIALAVKLKNVGVIGDEMAEIISPTPAEDGKPSPEQAQQMLEQAKGQMQQMGQALQQAQMDKLADTEKNKTDLEKAQISARVDLEKASMAAQNALDVQALRNAGAVQVAMVNLRGKGILSAQETDAELLALQESHAHEHGLEAAHAGHEAEMAQMAHEHGLEAGMQQTMGQADLQDQSHRQNLEAGEQQSASAADLAAQQHAQSLEAQAQPEAGNA